MALLARSSGSEGGGLPRGNACGNLSHTTKFWRFPSNTRVYDDFPIADESPDARCAVAVGIKVAKEDHFGHSSFIQRRAAYWGNREETLREAEFSLRAGLRDLSAYLRQD